jgi:hypothetical protein
MDVGRSHHAGAQRPHFQIPFPPLRSRKHLK